MHNHEYLRSSEQPVAVGLVTARCESKIDYYMYRFGECGQCPAAAAFGIEMIFEEDQEDDRRPEIIPTSPVALTPFKSSTFAGHRPQSGVSQIANDTCGRRPRSGGFADFGWALMNTLLIQRAICACKR